MRQVRFNILSFEKSGDKAMVTILGGQVEVATMPDDLNKEDYQVLETLTSTDNPAVFDAEYRFVRCSKHEDYVNHCLHCYRPIVSIDDSFCSESCSWAFIFYD